MASIARGRRRSDPWQDELYALECELIDPGARSDAARLDEILADDFVEFGSSGRVYDKEALIAMLSKEQGAPVLMRDFAVRRVDAETALVTYRTVGQTGREARRSSVWVRTGSHWKIVFHQGTRIPNSWGAIS